MKKQFVVLIADRNPRICAFIQRELKYEGYRAVTAENAGQLGNWIKMTAQLDALVIDPNMPGVDSFEQIRVLLSIRPTLPVIFHCLAPNCSGMQDITQKVIFVEKNGHSVDSVKEQIRLLFGSVLADRL